MEDEIILTEGMAKGLCLYCRKKKETIYSNIRIDNVSSLSYICLYCLKKKIKEMKLEF